jgi:hypothetical protein
MRVVLALLGGLVAAVGFGVFLWLSPGGEPASIADEADVGSAQPADEVPTGASRVFELRTYTAAEGKLQALLDRFGGGETALFEKHGMRGIGYWVPTDEPLAGTTLVYMLAHESRDAAAASWQAFGADPEWAAMRDASQVDGRLVSNVESIFLDPTDFSPAR